MSNIRNVDEALDVILDCFAGADGGVSFAHLKGFIRQIKESEQPQARELELIVVRFARLIEVNSPQLVAEAVKYTRK